MAKTYDTISTTTLGSDTAGITFSSIPSTYTDLKLVITGLTASSTDLRLQINGVTTNSYGTRNFRGNGTSATGAYNYDVNSVYLSSGTATSSTYPFFCEVNFLQYKNTSVRRSMLITFAGDTVGSGTTQRNIAANSTLAAISSLYIFTSSGANLSSGTTATLFGITAA